MFGTNPIRKPVKGGGQVLEVQEIFATVQGEGPRAGEPSVFVRLGGCNLACHFCDTEFESYQPMPLDGVVAQVEALAEDGSRLVVLTGGEPFRQEIGPLCDALLEKGYSVQIETNGTLFRPLDARVEIVCSPKASHGTYHALRPDVLARATALKFIVSAGDAAYSMIPEVGQAQHHTPVYVQPMDEQCPDKNAANLAYALALAERSGNKVSLQLHKYFGID
ncbi:MAG: 7-carboxy-7-deazaguanine synthase QueE [Hyphomicrobiales bacterium]|nr:7-carboxy-7-deazaguanine synthase QueE [Hyphomicrobiales bacterium]